MWIARGELHLLWKACAASRSNMALSALVAVDALLAGAQLASWLV